MGGIPGLMKHCYMIGKQHMKHSSIQCSMATNKRNDIHPVLYWSTDRRCAYIQYQFFYQSDPVANSNSILNPDVLNHITTAGDNHA